jgi:hypothetical protein
MMIQNTKKSVQQAGSYADQITLSANREKINMYDEPPRTTISLHEFNTTALNRLQLLRKIEFM